MNLKRIVAMILCTQYACVTWSMQPLNESDLADTTGQDGLSIGLQFPNSTVSYDQMIMTNKGGIAGSTTHNKDASLVIAPATNNSSQGVRLFKDNTSTVSDRQIEVSTDVDGNAGKPVANIHIALPDTARIRINPFSIYMASGDSNIFTARKIDGITSNTLRSNVREIVKFNTEGLDIVFKSDNPLDMNVQLGNAAQGAMLKFTSGSLLCIATNGMCVSGSDDNGSNPIEVLDASGSSIKLGLKMSATDQGTGFRLHSHGTGPTAFGGFYAVVADQGLVFGGKGTTDKFDLTLSHLRMGKTGCTGVDTTCQSATVFNNLKNGSIGNIGMKGMAVTDFKMTVKGL